MVELMIVQPHEVAGLVEKAVALDEEIRARKKALDEIKAKLQATALHEMENKNLRYVRYDADHGTAEMSYKTKFEIDNYAMLAEAIADAVLVEDKIQRKTSVKYEVDARFREALTALVKHDYAAHDIDALLIGMGLDDEKTRKLVRKNLKGGRWRRSWTLSTMRRILSLSSGFSTLICLIVQRSSGRYIWKRR